jgi:hypothetical protein
MFMGSQVTCPQVMPNDSIKIIHVDIPKIFPGKDRGRTCLTWGMYWSIQYIHDALSKNMAEFKKESYCYCEDMQIQDGQIGQL